MSSRPSRRSLRAGCDPGMGLPHAQKVFFGGHPSRHVGVVALLEFRVVRSVVHRRDDQAADSIGVAQAHGERHHPSHTEAEDIGTIEVEKFEERRHVIGQGVQPHRSVDVTRVPVPLQFNADHLMALGQRRDERTKGQVDGQEAAMEKDQGRGPGRAPRSRGASH